MRTALFWVITQRVVVNSCRCSGTPYRFHLKRPTGCPETSVRSHNYTLPKNAEKCSSQVWLSYLFIFPSTRNKFTNLHTSRCVYPPLLHSSTSCRLERLACQGPETLHHSHIYSTDNRKRKQYGWTLSDTSLLCPHQRICLSSIPSHTIQNSNVISFGLFTGHHQTHTHTHTHIYIYKRACERNCRIAHVICEKELPLS
jgi:hypothetical protein